MAPGVLQAGRFGSTGQFIVSGSGELTVKVELHVSINGVQLLWTSKVKINCPPQVISVVRVGMSAMLVVTLHPPEVVNPAFHKLYAARTAAGVLQAGKFGSTGQFIIRGSGELTVNVEVHDNS